MADIRLKRMAHLLVTYFTANEKGRPPGDYSKPCSYTAHWRSMRVLVTWVNLPSAITATLIAVPKTSSSMRKWVALFTSHWVQASPKLAAAINQRYIGTWSAICAKAAKSTLMMHFSVKMVNSSSNNKEGLNYAQDSDKKL